MCEYCKNKKGAVAGSIIEKDICHKCGRLFEDIKETNRVKMEALLVNYKK